MWPLLSPLSACQCPPARAALPAVGGASGEPAAWCPSDRRQGAAAPATCAARRRWAPGPGGVAADTHAALGGHPFQLEQSKCSATVFRCCWCQWQCRGLGCGLPVNAADSECRPGECPNRPSICLFAIVAVYIHCGSVAQLDSRFSLNLKPTCVFKFLLSSSYPMFPSPSLQALIFLTASVILVLQVVTSSESSHWTSDSSGCKLLRRHGHGHAAGVHCH